MKKSTIKLANTTDFYENLDFLVKKYQDIIVKSTAYSYKIETPQRNYFFSDNPPIGFFGAFSKIKSDINKLPSDFLPQVDKKKIVYYRADRLEAIKPTMYLIDITAAYPTTAYLHNIITEKTYLEIMKIPKTTRLKIFGALARNEIQTYYKNGQIIDVKQNPSLLSNYFFYLCYEVGLFLNTIFYNFNSTAIFWVDGIFCNNLRDAELILQIFENRGYTGRIEIRENCRINEKKTVFFYSKDGENKFMPLPQRRVTRDKTAIDFLNNK